jgi:hypothetical protein
VGLIVGGISAYSKISHAIVLPNTYIFQDINHIALPYFDFRAKTPVRLAIFNVSIEIQNLKNKERILSLIPVLKDRMICSLHEYIHITWKGEGEIPFSQIERRLQEVLEQFFLVPEKGNVILKGIKIG